MGTLFFFAKDPKMTFQKNTAPSTNCSGHTRWMDVEKCKQIHIYTPAQIVFKMSE